MELRVPKHNFLIPDNGFMKSILVTGANGQLGSEFQRLAESAPDYDFVFTDREDLDITNENSVKEYFRSKVFDCVINCAAYTKVDLAEEEGEAAMALNAGGVKNLAEASRKAASVFIHFSTDYVFDGNQSFPYKEGDKINPVTAYGLSKAAGEDYAKISDKYLIIRTSWLYSVFGHNFVKTIARLAQNRDELRVVNDQIGSPTYAGNLAKAVMQILPALGNASGESFPAGIYHYSDEGACSWYDFACEIVRQAQIDCKITPVPSSAYPTPARRPSYSLLDKSKIKKTFGVEVNPWQKGLEDFFVQYSYYKKDAR